MEQDKLLFDIIGSFEVVKGSVERMLTLVFLVLFFSDLSLAGVGLESRENGNPVDFSGDIYLNENHAYSTVKDKNIFFRFKEINLLENESLTFGAGRHYQNVIASVLGERPVKINGIVNVDGGLKDSSVYLISPNGISIGGQAELNIDAGIFLSTSDYIEFKDGSRYFAKASEGVDMLDSDPVAFGFLSQYSGEAGRDIDIQNVDLELNGHVSMVGENITLDSAKIDVKEGGFLKLKLSTQAGKTGDAGKVFLVDNGSEIVAAGSGQIAMINKSRLLNANIEIETGELMIGRRNQGEAELKSSIKAKNSVSITTTGATRINSGSVVLIRENDGSIAVNSGILEVMEDASINTAGNIGDINVNAKKVVLSDGGYISSSYNNLETKTAGNIEISASEEILVSGKSEDDISRISARSYRGSSSGYIYLNSPRISIKEGGKVFANASGTGGVGGAIYIDTDELVVDSGEVLVSGDNEADAGNIYIYADSIINLTGDAAISSNVASGQGNGGNINFNVNWNFTDINAEASGTTQLLLSENGEISTSVEEAVLEGNGGNITINERSAKNGIVLSDESKIHADTTAIGGVGGKIIISGQAFFSQDVLDRQVTAKAPINANEGDINVYEPKLDITSSTVSLPEGFLDVTNVSGTRCTARQFESSRFYAADRAGIAATPDALIAGYNDFKFAGNDELNGQTNTSLNNQAPQESTLTVALNCN